MASVLPLTGRGEGLGKSLSKVPSEKLVLQPQLTLREGRSSCRTNTEPQNTEALPSAQTVKKETEKALEIRSLISTF